MGKILTWGCQVKPREVTTIYPISETGRANILKMCIVFAYSTLEYHSKENNINVNTIYLYQNISP